MRYTVTMSDDQCSRDEIVDATTLVDAIEQAESETRDWVEDGAWGIDGATVDARWSLCDDEGDEVADGCVTVEVEPDHDALIRAAGGDTTCDHRWTSEGEGGCAENPGVWDTGGTSLSVAAHCTRCGLHRVERRTGCQRNPGECDTVEYSQSEPDDEDD